MKSSPVSLLSLDMAAKIPRIAQCFQKSGLGVGSEFPVKRARMEIAIDQQRYDVRSVP